MCTCFFSPARALQQLRLVEQLLCQEEQRPEAGDAQKGQRAADLPARLPQRRLPNPLRLFPEDSKELFDWPDWLRLFPGSKDFVFFWPDWLSLERRTVDPWGLLGRSGADQSLGLLFAGLWWINEHG